MVAKSSLTELRHAHHTTHNETTKHITELKKKITDLGRIIIHLKEHLYRHIQQSNDHTGKEDVKDLIFASPTMTKSFKDFWVDEDLGSDHRTINATFSSQPLTYNKHPKTILLYHKAD